MHWGVMNRVVRTLRPDQESHSSTKKCGKHHIGHQPALLIVRLSIATYFIAVLGKLRIHGATITMYTLYNISIISSANH